jgi:hypothetical protein
MNRAAVVFGMLFVLIGGAYLLEDLGLWTIQLSYLFPALLIVVGLTLALTAFGTQRQT